MAKTVRQALKGRGDFISDIYARDMLYGATVRSPYPRAAIRSIRTDHLPDGVTCITAADVPGRNHLQIHDESMPILAEDESRYVGEPVALLAASSQREVVAATGMIEVDYQPLPPSFTFASVSGPAAADETLVGTYERGDVEGALAASAMRVEGTYRTGIQEHLYNEPQGAMVFTDRHGLVVRAATQWPFHVRSTVAAALGIAERSCVVRPADPGIALDGKLWYPSLVSAHAALLASASGRPVKLVYSNIEDFRYTSKRAPFDIRIVSALAPDGEFHGADIDVRWNAGAYPLFTDEIAERVSRTLFVIYSCPNLRVRVSCTRTNLPPLNVLSGFGAAAALFATETHVARMVEVANDDPAEWRKTRLIGRGENGDRGARSARTARQSERVNAVFDAVVREADFARKHAAYELQKKRRAELADARGTTHGIGIAIGTHGAGFIGEHESRYGGTITVRLETDGSAVLRTSAIPGGRAVASAWRRRVAEILGLDLADVTIENSDTASVPDTGPSTLSRNVAIVSALVEQACTAIQKKRFRSPLPMEVRRSHRSARLPDFAQEGGVPFTHAGFAAAAVEVGVDPVTFESSVEQVWLAVDAGRILDEAEARRNLEMSVYQALEWATHELIVYRNGSIDPRSYLAYRNIADPVLPRISISLVASAEKAPLGLGELPQNCIPAALAAAVSQATGRYMDRLPTNPALIHGYLEAGDEEAG